MKLDKPNSGFTLVEMMVALFLGVIATVGMYKTYVNYSIAADVQDQTLELQQNLRTAMNSMIREIRMAGYNPKNAAGAGISVAKEDEVTFAMDLNDNGQIAQVLAEQDEKITYKLKNDGKGWGLYKGDEFNNGEYPHRYLDVPSGTVKPLNFIYYNKLRSQLIPAAGASLTAAEMQDVKFIQITLVFKSTNEDYSYTDSSTYTNLKGEALISAKNDHFRRQRLSEEVNIRNL